jgi:hypothetical protein
MLTSRTGYTHHVLSPRCRPHPSWLGSTLCLHPICSERCDCPKNRSPGLLGTPRLHDQSADLQTLRSGLLRSDSGSSAQTDVGNSHHRSNHDSTLASTDGLDHLPLRSCDSSLAVRFRSECGRVRVLAVGDRICYQQRHLPSMRLGALHHPCGHYQGAQDRHAGQAEAREHNDARFTGDWIVQRENVPGHSRPVGGMCSCED